MSEKSNLYLLIVCGFLCQGIVASLSATDIRNSSDLLVRNKRVINHEPGGEATVNFRTINYIVNIRHNSRSHCVGAILSQLTVITAAACVQWSLQEYDVQSGSAYLHRSQIHRLTSRKFHYGNYPNGVYDGIALVKVDPFFTYGTHTGYISLHVEPVLPGTLALMSGWGMTHPTSPSMPGRSRLRSINLPIMNHRECVASYADRFNITNKHICTFEERKLCGTQDLGTPLVIDNLLVGIHIYKGNCTQTRNPDVFVDVQIPEYSVWIRANTLHR